MNGKHVLDHFFNRATLGRRKVEGATYDRGSGRGFECRLQLLPFRTIQFVQSADEGVGDLFLQTRCAEVH